MHQCPPVVLNDHFEMQLKPWNDAYALKKLPYSDVEVRESYEISMIVTSKQQTSLRVTFILI